MLAGSGPLSLDAAVADPSQAKGRCAGGARLQGDLGRRAFLGQLGAAGVVGAAGLFVAGATAAIGRAANRGTSTATKGLTPLGGGTTGTTASGATRGSTPGSTSPTSVGSTPGSTSPTSGGSNPAGTSIGKASDVPVGGAASFTDPATSQPAYVVQPSSGEFVAFSAICTHLGCTVGFQAGSPTRVRVPVPWLDLQRHDRAGDPGSGSPAAPADHGRRGRTASCSRTAEPHSAPCSSPALGGARGTVSPREDTGRRLRPRQQLVPPSYL